MLRNKPQDVEEAIEIGVGTKLEGLGRNLHDGDIIKVGVIKEGEAVGLIEILILFINFPGEGDGLIFHVI